MEGEDSPSGYGARLESVFTRKGIVGSSPTSSANMSQSLILIPVPAADPVVGYWRKKYDKVANHGIPSHVTLLFPFKEPSLITKNDLIKLNGIFSKIEAFLFTLEKISTFPGVIFLEPKPRNKFIEITEKIVKVFPKNPPYEGKFATINPHLTIGQLANPSEAESLKETIRHDIKDKLPIKSTAEEVWLMTEKDGEWNLKRKFNFI